MRTAGDPYAFAELVFDGETSYARADASGGYRVVLSTNPFREGQLAPIIVNLGLDPSLPMYSGDILQMQAQQAPLLQQA